jgi:hypothetical protein
VLYRSNRSCLLFIPLSFPILPLVYSMDTEHTLLSCPGRVQDWLGAAADQIETLLHVPLPSLSGSDQAIGALRLERETPSWLIGPYSLRPTNLDSGTFPVTGQVPPSVSSDRPLCGEKSPDRCENCVAKKGSRCSRDLPSCVRCRKNGLCCFYAEDVPTGRRKPQERTRVRREELGLSVGQFLVVPASKSPALLETGEAQAAQCHRPHIHLLQAVSEYTQSSSEKYPTIPLVDSSTDTPSAGNRMNSHHQTVATKRQVTMLPATPTFSTLLRRASKLEIARETAKVELRSMWPGVIADGLNPSSMRGM